MSDPSRRIFGVLCCALLISGCSLFESDALDPVAAQEQFCSDVESYVEAIGRYGGLFQDVELTVGDVKSADQELQPGLEAVEASAEEFAKAVETDPSSGLSIELVDPETIDSVKRAEEEFAKAGDIEDRTPVVDAGVEFSSAAYQLEVAWVRLFVDAGCLEGDAEVAAKAQAWVAEYVTALQTDLRAVGYYQGEIDGLYGPMTVQAVQQFQADNGLPETGLFDPPTQAAMQLALGTRESAQVGALQALMIATGHYSGQVDGVWSPEVESALKDLQADLGVPASGVIDSATLRALEDALAASGEEPSVPTVPSTPVTSVPSEETTTTTVAATTTTIQQTTTTTAPASGGVLDVLAEAGQFEQFLAAVETAGLTEALSGPGPMTVFAPTDEAFEAAGELPSDPEALADLIRYHVVDGALTGFDIQDEDSLETLQGRSIAIGVDQGLITLNETSVVTVANIAASNGYAHAINAVLGPPG